MHKEILSAAQVTLLPLVQEFKREYYLVGGVLQLHYILVIGNPLTLTCSSLRQLITKR